MISNRLMNTPMSAALFDQYFVNFGLVDKVQYLTDAVELKHRGNAFGIVRRGRLHLFYTSFFLLLMIKNISLRILADESNFDEGEFEVMKQVSK